MHITCDHLQTTHTKASGSSADTSTDKEVIRADLLEAFQLIGQDTPLHKLDKQLHSLCLIQLLFPHNLLLHKSYVWQLSVYRSDELSPPLPVAVA